MKTTNKVNNQQVAEQPKTDKQQAAQQKREWLRTISAEMQAKQEILEMMGEEVPTINQLLREYYEKENNITELNTFEQWKEKGYQVRKGEKAFLFWGKPKNKKTIQPTEEGEEPKEVITDNFYPICYLFDISQCHK